MYLKDLNIDIPYRTTNATYNKGSSNLAVMRMQFILPFKTSVFIFGLNSYCQNGEHQLYNNHFQLSLQDQFPLLNSKMCFFHWWNSDSGEGNEMLLQCLSTNAEQIQCILKIVFEYMITQMTQRTTDKGPSNRFFCNTNVLGIDF